MKEAHKTGMILHRVYLPEEIDIRFQQSVGDTIAGFVAFSEFYQNSRGAIVI